jgi:hypothetical protein
MMQLHKLARSVHLAAAVRRQCSPLTSQCDGSQRERPDSWVRMKMQRSSSGHHRCQLEAGGELVGLDKHVHVVGQGLTVAVAGNYFVRQLTAAVFGHR